jgi:putative membrane protein
MRIIVGALWLVLFLILFAFAVNNTALTDLHFFAGMSWKAPLIALLLAFFVAGFACGFIALMPAWVRQRVELRRLRRLAPSKADSVPASGAPPRAQAPEESADAIQSIARGARTTT